MQTKLQNLLSRRWYELTKVQLEITKQLEKLDHSWYELTDEINSLTDDLARLQKGTFYNSDWSNYRQEIRDEHPHTYEMDYREFTADEILEGCDPDAFKDGFAYYIERQIERDSEYLEELKSDMEMLESQIGLLESQLLATDVDDFDDDLQVQRALGSSQN